MTTEQPACTGAWPQLFDFEEYFPHALQICDQCPVRSWCLQLVDPARSFYDGVAGGHTWANGRLKCRSCLRTDPVLIHYMKTADRYPPNLEPIPGP